MVFFNPDIPRNPLFNKVIFMVPKPSLFKEVPLYYIKKSKQDREKITRGLRAISRLKCKKEPSKIKKEPLKIAKRLPCIKSLFNVADLVNGMWKLKYPSKIKIKFLAWTRAPICISCMERKGQNAITCRGCSSRSSLVSFTVNAEVASLCCSKTIEPFSQHFNGLRHCPVLCYWPLTNTEMKEKLKTHVFLVWNL